VEAFLDALRKGISSLYYSGHAEFTPGDPLSSAIICADSRLEVRHLLGVDLRTCRFVLLAACETQLGAGGGGRDVLGLAHVFLRAGVPTTVATLWPVRDEPTSRIVLAFHARVARGEARLDALVEAQRDFIRGRLEPVVPTDEEAAAIRRTGVDVPEPPPAEVRGDGRPKHPYLWAGFTYSGAW
jgi:CHAT domain-containing protein